MLKCLYVNMVIIFSVELLKGRDENKQTGKPLKPSTAIAVNIIQILNIIYFLEVSSHYHRANNRVINSLNGIIVLIIRITVIRI